jgi:hypothetical protein
VEEVRQALSKQHITKHPTTMMLKDYFDRIVLLTLPYTGQNGRTRRCAKWKPAG